MNPPKLWHYYLPSIKSVGWAEIVIGSNGFFAAVSDYGNYSFAWRSMGVPARQFFLRAHKDWDYFASKLAHGHQMAEYDGDATQHAVREGILKRRRMRELSPDEAAYEWRVASGYDLANEHEFSMWYGETRLPDAHEFRRTRVNCQLQIFCQVTLSRLADALLAELDAEAARAGAAP